MPMKKGRKGGSKDNREKVTNKGRELENLTHHS